MIMKKKIALIGCGGIGDYHLNHLLEFSDIELVVFCDLIIERATAFANRAGSSRAYGHYSELIENEKPDAVFLCIPPYAHGEIEFALIERGIHFFVEKPVVLDVELGKKIRDAAREASLITAVGFQCRYSGLVQPHVSFLEKHPTVHITCTRIGGIPEAPWWIDKHKSGGQMVEQTIHNIDMMRYLCGEAKTVFSLAARGFIDAEGGYDTDDMSAALIQFENGVLATIVTGCYGESGEAADNKITFSSKEARSDLRILSRLDLFYEENNLEETAEDGFVIRSDGGLKNKGKEAATHFEDQDAGILCDRCFIDAILSGDSTKIKSDYTDGLKSVALTLAFNQSIDSGLAVEVAKLI